MDIRFSHTESWTDIRSGTKRNSTSVFRATDKPPNAEAIAYITGRRVGPKLTTYRIVDARSGREVGCGIYSIGAAKIKARQYYEGEAR